MISVIIPTHNRYRQLIQAVKSVKEQKYKNVEIIIVDDCSTDETALISAETGTDFENCNIIHLKENSRVRFGYPCAGYVRNIGASAAKGQFLAFLDDDDIWLPCKLSKQIYVIEKYDAYMSCTDGYIGKTPTCELNASELEECEVYNEEHYFNEICNIYERAGKTLFVNKEDGFSLFWKKEMIDIHNCIITSSVLIDRELFLHLKGFMHFKNGEEDWDLWKRALEYTDCVYINMPCFYYYYNNYYYKHI